MDSAPSVREGFGPCLKRGSLMLRLAARNAGRPCCTETWLRTLRVLPEPG